MPTTRRADPAFSCEAEITGGLEHPGIVPVYGLGHYADGRPFYAMRFIRGDTLKEAIDRFHKARGEPRDPGASRRVPQAAGPPHRRCNAMAYAHSRGVFAPRPEALGNIMLGKYGETLVVDGAWPRRRAAPEGGERLASEAAAETRRRQPPEPSCRRQRHRYPAIHEPRASGRPRRPARYQPATSTAWAPRSMCLLTGASPQFTQIDRGRGVCCEKWNVEIFPSRGRCEGRGNLLALEAVCLKAMAPEHRGSLCFGPRTAARSRTLAGRRTCVDIPGALARPAGPVGSTSQAARHGDGRPACYRGRGAGRQHDPDRQREASRARAAETRGGQLHPALERPSTRCSARWARSSSPKCPKWKQRTSGSWRMHSAFTRRLWPNDLPTLPFKSDTGRAQQRLAAIQDLLGDARQAEAAYRQSIALFESMSRTTIGTSPITADLARAFRGAGDRSQEGEPFSRGGSIAANRASASRAAGGGPGRSSSGSARLGREPISSGHAAGSLAASRARGRTGLSPGRRNPAKPGQRHCVLSRESPQVRALSSTTWAFF